ncbi:xanthine dehydrogenase/oxidase-like isoform X2 [Mizuhopecten yessoensis]|uniref:Xanthine dehydrogenase/oxidase n=2 Tax=Mizuhopecten yessoensis TaxID=6573 RepID=A0A210QBI4_MIZYE|nr:xanthine dehydrogenase/oxidase-like isoform X2 [Mizuhopecten yessoensis]XP_021362467.1 xanthine dehydrogenase/oxidase-like isoform X2 [Mizuhopecten yessoensis]XP_021362468.1 xanthine dehydrogenase/oxidase-like isoform X2 [Mizuhopecten yessoensis]XP_021362469.1 xanthine dehydrogenase/oxidase-like isoform X2 [Mizuhopecten yessoensis]OWF46075.1 Xanthine dehydrogenase/oxidase [Mizuhopecten yessoensis]
MDPRNTLVFFVNGKKIEVGSPSPETTLLQYLRQTLYLTGTKSACGQGACGACTVMMSSYDVTSKSMTHVSVNACLVPLCYLHGRAVTTVEGVGNSRTGLHAVQKGLVEAQGFQCGFCTPGMVMTMYTLFRNNPSPSQEQMERMLEGNLCRCTGYRPIVDAFVEAKKNCPCGLGLCQQTNETSGGIDETPREASSQDVIFPPELQLTETYHTEDVVFRGDRYTWYRPTTLAGILQLKADHQGAPVVMGCNSIGYLLRKGILTSDVVICGTNVKELTIVETTLTEVRVGAGVTMASLEKTLNEISVKIKGPKNRSVLAALDVLRWIGVDQIRNTATIGGHVMSHAPNLDLQAFLMAAGAELQFLSQGKGPRTCKLDDEFINNEYSHMGDGEILSSITIPFTSENEYIVGMKQPHRRGFDYGIVTCGLFVELDTSTRTVRTMRLAFGGVDKKPVLALSTTNNSVGKTWSDDIVTEVCGDLIIELNNNYYDNTKFRLTLACSFVYKFFLYVQGQLKKTDSSCSQCDVIGLPYTTVSGTQAYDVPSEDGHRIVWKPVPNVSSEYVTSGEAQFVDDIPTFQSELFAVPVTSKHAHARILSVDPSQALALPGVVDYIDHSHVPGTNKFSVINGVCDSTLFAENEVFCYGQVIGAVLAESRTVGVKAAQLVNITYEKMNAILTIEEALEKDSLFEEVHRIDVGDLEGVKETASHCVEGTCSTGVQEHLYMETQTALVVPKLEQRELEVFAPTQILTATQQILSDFLAIPRNRLTVKIKRIGGAFGGKQGDTMSVVGIAAVGAWKTKRPVRCVLDRTTDIQITGKRHPAKTLYKVYFSDDGRILGLNVKFYINAGYSLDCSPFVVKIASWFLNGSYNIPNIKSEGRMCKTNLPSNTAMRGFGAPQMLFAVEHIVQQVATRLKMSPEEVRQINLIRQGSVTASRQLITDNNMARCWTECRADSQLDQRRQEIVTFNSTNRWTKRGIAMIPIAFGVGYAPLFANQAGALLLVYLDGSVLLTHGGVEMGQGVHTKMIQVAATELDISQDKIIISEVSTATVPNTSESGGTQVADLNAGAVKNACVKIRDRLEPFRKAKPDGTWEDWVNAAYDERVSLAATGIFKSREEGYDFATNTGVHANYFTYGTACTEVEIDCLTGGHQVRRVDIVMDVGKSLNPAIDVGQIEGGFVMGYGMMTMEQIQFTAEGRMKASGPLEYKIPCVRNIPREFKVKLLQDSGDVKTVYSSKGVGEPPLLLASSVFFAIKEAVQAARAEVGLTDDYPLKCPATAERIRMACQDNIVDQCQQAEMKTSSNPLVTI